MGNALQFESSPFVPAPEKPENKPIPENAAVLRCVSAYEDAYRAAMAQRKGEGLASFQAAKAYCKAIPPLTGITNIRNYIACVAHGMLTDIVLSDQGSRLLYAAQVAYGAQKRRPPKRSKSPQTIESKQDKPKS